MEKRYQVFVSSTYEDLKEERQEVMQALLELDCIPSGMELFPAADQDQWTLIKRVIDDCDYYIVIIGGRYGSVNSSGISYTQMEYEYAIETGKPIIAFLHKNPGSIPADRTEKDQIKASKLEEFRELSKKKTVKYWESPAELGSVVSRSLVKLIKSNPAVGWVKANNLPDNDLVQENLQLRKKLEDKTLELEQAILQAPSGTELLSQGDDFIELTYTFEAFKPTEYIRGKGIRDMFKMTWNDIFAKISPHMIDEISDDSLMIQINRVISEVKVRSLKEVLGKQYARFDNFRITDDDFNTIKIQFIALNLIRKSRKSKSIKDTSTYWTLTPYGESTMMKLRAVKKAEVKELESEIGRPEKTEEVEDAD